MNRREGIIIQEKVKYLNIAKGIGIILVVFAHVLIEYGVLLNVKKIIYSFHMPLFFVISGCCLYIKYSDVNIVDFNVFGEIKKIIFKFLPIYVVWSFCIFAFGCYKKEVLCERLIAIFTGRGIAPIWFVWQLMVVEIAFVVCLALYYNVIVRKKSTSSDSYRNSNDERNKLIYMFVMMLICLCVGYILHKFMHRYGMRLKFTSTTLYYVAIALSRSVVCYAMLLFGYVFYAIYHNKLANSISKLVLALFCLIAVVVIKHELMVDLDINLHLFVISNYLIFITSAVLGSVGIIVLSDAIEKYSKCIAFLGEKSLAIMVLHYYPMQFISYGHWMGQIVSDNIVWISVIATVFAIVCAIVSMYAIEKGLYIVKMPKSKEKTAVIEKL